MYSNSRMFKNTLSHTQTWVCSSPLGFDFELGLDNYLHPRRVELEFGRTGALGTVLIVLLLWYKYLLSFCFIFRKLLKMQLFHGERVCSEWKLICKELLTFWCLKISIFLLCTINLIPTHKILLVGLSIFPFSKILNLQLVLSF